MIMALLPTSPLVSFKVQRREPELITPAKPTPHEFKPLSDIEDHEGLRFHVPLIQFYRCNPSMEGKDPVKVIRQALAETLVFYYPLAGRLREGPNRKLTVECTGEGILFIEADADVMLDQFGDSLHPPFPGFEELLFDVPGYRGVMDCPLFLIQVTRLRCGGFVFAIRLNHTLCDGPGLFQFMHAVGEIARGALTPSVLPVWERHIFSARDPPRVTCKHREYEEGADSKAKDTNISPENLVQRSFFFGPTEISALRRLVPPQLRRCSTFEILTACLWKCRTTALQPDPNDEMRMIFTVNARNKFKSAPPIGYYGNAFVIPAAVAAAGELCKNTLGYALELIKKTKQDVTEEYIQSVADLMVIKSRPSFTMVGTYVASDITRAGFGELDYGWGKPVYGGVAKAGLGDYPFLGTFYMPSKNYKGEKGTLVPICLPGPAMERFVKALDNMLKVRAFISSAL